MKAGRCDYQQEPHSLISQDEWKMCCLDRTLFYLIITNIKHAEGPRYSRCDWLRHKEKLVAVMYTPYGCHTFFIPKTYLTAHHALSLLMFINARVSSNCNQLCIWSSALTQLTQFLYSFIWCNENMCRPLNKTILSSNLQDTSLLNVNKHKKSKQHVVC